MAANDGAALDGPSKLQDERCSGRFLAFDDDGVKTKTSEEQERCEESCRLFYNPPNQYPAAVRKELFNEQEEQRLLKERHLVYLRSGLRGLNRHFTALDASRPWLAYWTIHSLDLLGEAPIESYSRAVDTLSRCVNTTGGFGGGPQQLAHCATTYAAVITLCIMSEHCEAAFDVLDAVRPSLYAHFMSLLDSASGGLRVHHGGEVDVRAAYLMVAVAYLLGILTPELGNDALAAYVLRCQTYEGGFGGEPGNEAHGGYTYCAVAALQIMGQLHRADVPQLTAWLAGRQMGCEGGYQGRTHKLVDGCYSFWQGGPAMTVGLEHAEAVAPGDDAAGGAPPVLPVALNQQRLGAYILHCCQQYQGGLRDKPSEKRDFYHSCYCLSGLSLCQQDVHGSPLPAERIEGGEENRLARTHPLFNMARSHVRRITQRYRHGSSSLPKGHALLLAAADAGASAAREAGQLAGPADNTVELPAGASNKHLAGACVVTASGKTLPPASD